MNKLVEALGKIRTITHYKAQTNNTIHLTIPTVHELAEQALQEHAANKEGWVRVEDRLPTESEDVLMTYKGNLGNWHTYTGYVFNEMWHFGEEGENVGDRIVTHWQPLPTPPTDQYRTERTRE